MREFIVCAAVDCYDFVIYVVYMGSHTHAPKSYVTKLYISSCLSLSHKHTQTHSLHTTKSTMSFLFTVSVYGPSQSLSPANANITYTYTYMYVNTANTSKKASIWLMASVFAKKGTNYHHVYSCLVVRQWPGVTAVIGTSIHNH